MCEELGFKDVFIDMSNSEMSFEIDEEDESEEKVNKERKKIHGSSPDFNHLQDYDINAMCKRVTVYGVKPE